MDRTQIENLYKANGLKDYMLKSLDDLMKVHGVNYKVDGYNRLDDVNKAIYEKFIVNIFNAWGIESRATLIPKGIYFVESIEYLVKEHPDDEFMTAAGLNIKAIDRNGLKTVLYNRIYEEYKDFEISESQSEFYLRFEYEHQGKKEWLHVLSAEKWY